MSESRPPPRLSLRFAAIGTLAGLMVLLPLGEVLRYQTDEIQTLMAERALLDPLAHAVGVQRSLLSHGELAGRVLAGRRQLENERRLRQAEVDAAVHELKGTLAAGLWERALAEADDLAHDWRDLAGRIQSGKLNVAGSQEGHRLLVEQSLQVMDLVSAGAGASHVIAWLGPVAAGRRSSGQTLGDAGGQRQAALDQAQSVLTARSVQLHGELGRLHAARTHQIAGLSFLLLTSLLLALATALTGGWRWQRQALAPPTGSSDPGQRRGHGRRSTDAQHPPDAAQGLIEQLRLAEPDAASPSQITLPPRP